MKKTVLKNLIFKFTFFLNGKKSTYILYSHKKFSQLYGKNMKIALKKF